MDIESAKDELERYLLHWEVVKAEHRKTLNRLRYAADVGGQRTYQKRYREENPDKVLLHDVRHNLARSLKLPASMIPDELVEVKAKQILVQREVAAQTKRNGGVR